MQTILVVSAAVGILILLWLGYSRISLRRRLNDYAASIRRVAEGESPPASLGPDVPGIEDLAGAVAALAAAFNLRLSAIDSERARLAAVLDQMTDGVLIADAQGRIQFANPTSEKIFESPNALGHTVAEVLRQHQLVETWRRCQATGEMQSESIELPARRQFLQFIAIPDRHAGGALLLVQDLTRVRRLETVRRDFVSNVSHELRTPLASLKALTETLQEGALDDPPAARRFLGRIETEVDALTQMATELLDLSRIESGQVALELAPVAPNRLLHSAAERMKLQAERAGLSLRVDCPDDLPEVRADLPRLEQVLVNLIHNAVKFTRPGGEVVLAAERDDAAVRFSVRDTGVGIPTDVLPRIFERFYKVDRARSSGAGRQSGPGGGGTGLGLSIARHLVEGHGGRIWAESAEGRGSTFFFTIPLG